MLSEKRMTAVTLALKEGSPYESYEVLKDQVKEWNEEKKKEGFNAEKHYDGDRAPEYDKHCRNS